MFALPPKSARAARRLAFRFTRLSSIDSKFSICRIPSRPFVVSNFGIVGMFNRIEVLTAPRRQASPATLDEFLQVGHASHLAPEGFIIISAYRMAAPVRRRSSNCARAMQPTPAANSLRTRPSRPRVLPRSLASACDPRDRGRSASTSRAILARLPA